MFRARQASAVASASWVIAAAVFALPVSSDRAHAQATAACEESADIAVLSSPLAPWKGAPLRVIVAAEKPLDGELSLVAPDGSVAAKSHDRRGGPPYVWIAEVASPAAGTWRATLARASGGCAASREIAVHAAAPPRPQSVAGSVWPLRNTWNRATENLFSAWVERLFDAPLEESLSWPALHQGLRDGSRNMLFNHLGLGEDSMNMILRPDCADLPYFLRGYFAFKMGLPFGYATCTRGDGGPPVCPGWGSIVSFGKAKTVLPDEPSEAQPIALQQPPRRASGLAGSFGEFMKVVGDTVHSGSGRTKATDNNTDYYPVSLSQETLRPGVVYADPYGHILMLVRRVAQADGAAGVFLAVDGQPDGTVARKRFWRGNFLFAVDPKLGSPGFKRFRPVVREASGSLRRLSNDEIAKNPQYADFSLDQSKMGVEDFYDRMDDVMSPSPLDPQRALQDVIASLDEQVKTRVNSVENGRKWQGTARADASMPDGAAIFETTGAWEDFATPSRDLRLLIAIDVVRGFPDRVARRPERYAMPAGKTPAQVKAELESVLATELATRKFSYPRSDGSQWTLSIKDVIDRSKALEMAYNLNDCVELRWGAPEKSEEAATCKRYAPQAQRSKMSKYRAWFNERRRPPRGA